MYILKTKNIVHFTVFIFIATLSASFISSINQPTIFINIIINILFILFFFIHALAEVPLLVKKLEIKKYVIVAFGTFILFGISVIWLTIIHDNYYQNPNIQNRNSFDIQILSNHGEVYLTILLTYIFSFIYGILTIDKEYKGNFIKTAFGNNIQKMSMLILHIFFLIFAVVFIFSSILNVPEINGENIWTGVYSSLLRVSTGYIFSVVIIPGLIQKKTFGKYLFIAIVSIILFVVLESWFNAIRSAAITYHADGTSSSPKDFLYFGWYLASLVTFLPVGFVSVFYFMTLHLIKSNNNYFSNIIGKRDIELRLLKSQVNPHFLFNSLNIIYATALEEGSLKTAETTSKLSNLIRYMMEDINLDFIPLGKEVKYVQDYINIQLSRCSADQNVEIKIENTENKQIAPGLLISFVENAFKYGINPSKTSYLLVKIDGSNGKINFECKNSINKNRTNKESGLGIGIKNVKQRLALIYPLKHNLEIEENDDFFTVKLNIFVK